MTIILGVLVGVGLLCFEDGWLAFMGIPVIMAGLLLNSDFRGLVADLLKQIQTKTNIKPDRPIQGRTHHKLIQTLSPNTTKQIRINDWKFKRQAFEELKTTPIYQHWKRAQYSRQDGRCAWCGKKIALNSYYTHTDHIKSLWQGGTNDFSNLVLSCKDCNMRKGASYEEGVTRKADWIKDNIYSSRD